MLSSFIAKIFCNLQKKESKWFAMFRYYSLFRPVETEVKEEKDSYEANEKLEEEECSKLKLEEGENSKPN